MVASAQLSRPPTCVTMTAGFECAAAEQFGSGGFDTAGNGDDLLFTFHGTWSGDHGHGTAADSRIFHLDHRIQRMEFTVGVFEWLLHPFDRFDDFHLLKQFNIDPGGIAHQTHDRLVHTLSDVGGDALSFDP